MRGHPESNRDASPGWSGRWITSGSDDDPAPLLRRELTVPAGVTHGRLRVAGLGLHRTTLNRSPVTDARLESGLTAYVATSRTPPTSTTVLTAGSAPAGSNAATCSR